jgi:tetratricopeptide (TPR) repeat protein
MLATLPAGALLVADGDDAFTLAYLQRVLGERTDATIYDRQGFVLRDVSDDPGAPPAPGEPLEAWRERRLTALVAASVLGPSPRPVLFMSLPGAPLPGGIEVVPYGILFRARAARADAPDDTPLWSRYREQDIAAQARRVGGPFAAAVAASYAMMRAEGALHRGDQGGAWRALDEAVATAPKSEAIRNGVGAIYGRLGLYARAIGEFEAAVAVKPASQRAWANLAMARELAGDRAGAAAARSRLRELQAP